MEEQNNIKQSIANEQDSSMVNQLGSVMNVSSQSVQITYASFKIRFAAWIIDFLILAIPLRIILEISSTSDGSEVISRIVTYLVTWTYYILMTSKYQATLGKMVVGIRVISDKNDNLTLGKIILRETVGKLVTGITVGVGFMMVVFTEKKQALHDMIASSVVVYKNPKAGSDGSKAKNFPVWKIILICSVPFLLSLAIGIGFFLYWALFTSIV